MVLTVTLNPCIDKTIYLERFEVGSCNRVRSVRSDLAGKGLNVATVLHNMREDTLCMGFSFRENGGAFERSLDERGVKHHFVKVDGSARTNIKLFDDSDGVMTEINEAGPLIPQSATDRLIDEISARLDHAHILVMSGSIPPGVPADIYATLIRMAHRRDVKTVLDASGEPFMLGLKEKPFLIKPNSLEFEQSFKEEIKSGMGPLEIARQVVDGGVSYLCISMGGDGALLVNKDTSLRAMPLSVKPLSLTGAGDSMVAGMCFAIRKRLGPADMLRYATAAAAGSIRREGTLLARESDVLELLPQVKVDPV